MKRIVLSLACIVIAAHSIAQVQNVTITSAVGQDIENFVKTNLLGEGVYIYNVTFNGVPGNIDARYPQIGTFHNTNFPGLQMNDGILITNGHIDAAKGPNRFTYRAIPIAEDNRYVDPVINSYGLADNAICCGTLDFDFVSLSPAFSFNYSFGSEEYNEFVGTLYHDVFVFYLTGPDPETGAVVSKNIAIVPGSVDADHPDGLPVSSSTVNNGTLGSMADGSIYSSGYGYSFDYSQYFYDNDNQNNNPGVEYDGLTTKLSASANILPCQPYHMHISVCHIGSNTEDSGVFLEGSSFGSPASQVGVWQWELEEVPQGTQKQIPISLNNTDFDNATVTVNFGGDAINGEDYICLADNSIPLNDGEAFSIDAASHSITIIPLDAADFSTPKSLDMYVDLSLCPEFPELVTHDTLHYRLVRGSSNPNQGIEAAPSDLVAIYPNPASDRVTVVAMQPITHIHIIDAAGRMVLDRATAEGTHVSLDVSDLLPGVYTVRIMTSGGQLLTRALVK